MSNQSKTSKRARRGTSNASATSKASKASQEQTDQPLYADWSNTDLAMACKLDAMIRKGQDVKVTPLADSRDHVATVERTKGGKAKGFSIRGTHNQASMGLDTVGPEVLALRAGLPANWRDVARAFDRDRRAGLVF